MTTAVARVVDVNVGTAAGDEVAADVVPDFGVFHAHTIERRDCSETAIETTSRQGYLNPRALAGQPSIVL